MSLKIIGAGFGRTGTSSLKAALEELGFGKCYHMEVLLCNPEDVSYWEAAEQGKPVNWDQLFSGYQATVDYPGYRHYQKLLQYYPDAKVLLSVREPEKWYESTYNTIYQAAPPLFQKIVMAFKLPFSARLRKLIRVFKLANNVWKEDFQGRFEDREFAISLFNKHVEEVKKHVPAEKLLIFDVKQGWEHLCNFLNVPIPNKPFPRLNDSSNVKARSREIIKGI